MLNALNTLILLVVSAGARPNLIKIAPGDIINIILAAVDITRHFQLVVIAGI